MQLHWIDLLIIMAYLVMTLLLGFYLSKRASKDLASYFLGGNTMKWYMLGLSNASGMWDISGTMWTVMILFVYGLKSAWIPWLWPVWKPRLRTVNVLLTRSESIPETSAAASVTKM
jgi:Na+/proline symporter